MRNMLKAVITAAAVCALLAGCSSAAPAVKSSSAKPDNCKMSLTATKTADEKGTPWSQVLYQGFDKEAALGTMSQTYGHCFTGYDGFKDTSGNGMYAPAKVLSVQDGMLDYYVHQADGQYLTAALTPQGYGGQLYGRWSLRFRSDTVAGYKIAFLLWPDSDKWADGEIDFPEGELGQGIYGYSHDVTGKPSHATFKFTTNQTMGAWHTLSIAWTPTGLTQTIDGVSKTTSNPISLPTKPMHWVLQAETSLSGALPAADAAGHIQVDWLRIETYQK